MLPERNVSAATIEDAYVSFILACNPAVSPATDTTALREAFRTPPRSDGKSFSIFTLYQLICQLEGKEIKTWAELALKLGVEPPDQDKGQSSQKIQQYAVRLKRWMHSMHVNAFFDYLMDRKHPYWTNIPTSPYPVSEHLRDGVAAKDDMALRALIPEIKPRRGRRRPDEDDQEPTSGRSPPQRQRLDEYVDVPSAPGSAAGAWSAHPDGSNEFGFPGQHPAPHDMAGVVQTHLDTPPPAWSSGFDGMNTPLSAYPQSAITPSTRMNYWADEPKSAITPSSASQSRRPGRRHGAKVVSSAWRSSGTGGSGKTRGRPPINRNGNHHTQPSATSQDTNYTSTPPVGHAAPKYPPPVTSAYPSHMEPTTTAPLPPMQLPDLTSMPTMNDVQTSGLPTPIHILTMPDNMRPLTNAAQPRSSRPNHISLQVPQRQGAEVHLASPPPPMTNMAGSMAESTLAMHPQSIPTTCAPAETPVLLSKYNPVSMDFTMSMDFPPVPSGQQSQTPSLVDTHSPLVGTNVGSGTTGATSVTPEIAPNVTVDMNLNSTRKPGEGHNAPKPKPRQRPVYNVRFGAGSPGDRTNVDEIEAFFMSVVFSATWYDENLKRIPPCSVEEASVLVDVVIEDLIKGADCKEAFLINLAALAGAKTLMSTPEGQVRRLETTPEHTKYDLSWELRFGDVVSRFSIIEVIEHARWKKMTTDVKASVARAVGLKTLAEELAERTAQTEPNQLRGFSATMDDGSVRFPMQVRTSDAAGRTSGQAVESVPSVTPSGQSYTTEDTAPINFGTPSGTHIPVPSGAATPAGVGGGTTSPTKSADALHDENVELAAKWEEKYKHLLHLLYKRDKQLDRTRYAVLQGLRKSYEHDDTRDV